MKNIALAIVSLVSFGVYAQEEQAVQTSADNPVFKSKTMVIDKETKTLTLTEDAYYKDGIIEITDAEQIVFDQANNELTATGLYIFTIDGSVEYTSGEGFKKLRYKIGDSVAYIE